MDAPSSSTHTVLAIVGLEPAVWPVAWTAPVPGVPLCAKGLVAKVGMVRDHLLRPLSRRRCSLTGRPSCSTAAACLPESPCCERSISMASCCWACRVVFGCHGSVARYVVIPRALRRWWLVWWPRNSQRSTGASVVVAMCRTVAWNRCSCCRSVGRVVAAALLVGMVSVFPASLYKTYNSSQVMPM